MLGKTIFVTWKGLNRLGSVDFVCKFQLLKGFIFNTNVIYTCSSKKKNQIFPIFWGDFADFRFLDRFLKDFVSLGLSPPLKKTGSPRVPHYRFI